MDAVSTPNLESVARCLTPLAAFLDSVKGVTALPQDKCQGLTDAMAEWSSAATAYAADRAALVAGLTAFAGALPMSVQTNQAQRSARSGLRPSGRICPWPGQAD